MYIYMYIYMLVFTPFCHLTYAMSWFVCYFLVMKLAIFTLLTLYYRLIIVPLTQLCVVIFMHILYASSDVTFPHHAFFIFIFPFHLHSLCVARFVFCMFLFS